MKRLPILFIFLFIGLHIIAQVNEIEWGVDNKRKSTLLGIFPDKGMDFYTYRISGNGILQTNRVAHYLYGEEVINKKIESRIGTNTVILENIMTFNGTLLGFFSDKKDGFNVLYMVKYDTEVDPYGEPILLSEYQLPRNWNNKGSFIIEESDNGNFLCVEYVIPAKKDNFDRYGFKILDTTFTTVLEGEYEVPFSSRNSSVDIRHVTNNGEFVLGVTLYNTGNNSIWRDYTAIDRAVILHVKKDTLLQYDLFLDNRRVFDFQLSSMDSNLVVTGTYGEPFANGAQGVFYQRINLNKQKIETVKIQPFPKKFIDDLKAKTIRFDRTRGNLNRSSLDVVNYAFRDIHQLPDGNLIVVAEQFYVYQQTSNDTRGMVQTVNHYYYDDAIVYKIDTNGDFSWIVSIPKEQHSTNDYGYYSSLKSVVSNGKCLIFFNDYRKNYDDVGVFKNFNYSVNFPVRKKQYALAMAEIAISNGEMRRYVFNDYSQTGGFVAPKLAADNKRRRELLFFSSGRKERFGLFRY